jgi:hypothetical protein
MDAALAASDEVGDGGRQLRGDGRQLTPWPQ